MAQVDVATAETTLGDQGGDAGGAQSLTGIRTLQHHMRQPWRQGHGAQGVTMRGQDALTVQRVQAREQRAGLSEGRGGWRIKECQIGGVLRAPAGKVERQARKVGIKDLRIGIGRQGAGLGLVPQAIAGAGLSPPGSPPALGVSGDMELRKSERSRPGIRLISSISSLLKRSVLAWMSWKSLELVESSRSVAAGGCWEEERSAGRSDGLSKK